ncbi:LysR family transcriptional regulator [Pseudomonas sp. MAFF212428]|uniref:LysR family transcriptional regulator n=1 Tax=Pseudomonas brassicae TaxID=2708063 RepID=A0A6B3NYQ1_9PSED|nr:LysR family transcriptional regulator [Pseudomonas brassicae]NER62128.1 LysR family transcriptional regulator [Pseudomonas brassicae]NER65310.1 LysR family transcriptional regulator [Pseudomonas brassicae]
MFSSERLKGIDVFVCVADLGSFKAAAERLNLTGSAVSKSVARLEARLQARLFERTTRRVALTEAGRAFYRTCSGVLAELEEAELALNPQDSQPRGRVRIDLPAAFGRLHALPAILACVRVHGLLMPHITFSDRFVDPVESGIDLFVRIGGPQAWPTGVSHRYLGSQRVVLCAAPAYLEQHGTPLHARALEQHHCIVYGLNDGLVGPWHFPSAQPGHTERRTLPARMAVGDAEGQVSAVLAGYGIAQLPTWLIKRQLAEGSLVQVLPHLATQGLPIHLAWLTSRQAQPKVSTLLAHLGQSLSGDGFDPG